MRTNLVSLLVCAALGGCASDSAQDVAQEEKCEQGEPATGSLVVRRDRCVISTEESRKQARARADAMREEQDRRRALPKQVGG